ncbi:MAG TPA: acyl-CoA dehydrogenase family protein [Polyangiaceae bacterium]|nr:acyl-CoA dehydrogenase family protein [Polyangiaceae bacterium]
MPPAPIDYPERMTSSPAGSSLDELSAIDAELDEEERLVRESVRRFVRERYLPRAAELYAREEFPRDLVPELAELGVLGASITGYGCAGMSPVAYGLMLEELEYGDSGLRSFTSVQGSLAMFALYAFGSEEQKQHYLPAMARGQVIGCFGLTEPDSGSDPGSLQTRARRDGADFVLSGTKMWITNAPIADLAVVWAKTDDGGAESIRGFVVERGTPGFETSRIHGKMSLRASETGALHFDGCRVPARAALEHKPGLGAALQCLAEARFGISWGAVGAAKACFDCVLAYTKERVQFGVPIAKKQLVQAALADMASAIVRAELLSLHYGRSKQRVRKLSPAQVSLCKRNNVEMALETARTARSLLGANGILLEYPVIRHLMNLESVYTYEGTHEIHTLVLGKALTGEDAF